MGRVFHLLLLDHGGGIENASVFAGTSLGSAAAELLRHLVATWPDEDWSNDADVAIERLNRDLDTVSRRVHHLMLDLEEALAHEHDGENPMIGIVPASAYRDLQASLAKAGDNVRHRVQAEKSGGNPDGFRR